MNNDECLSSRIEELPDSALVARLNELITQERHCLAEFLLHLAAFDRRRGYLELGYDSLFVYCRDSLKMSKGTAYRRAAAARLIRRFPPIIDFLRDGRLCTTSVCLLRKVLTEDNHLQLLERASTMSEDEIKLLAAALNPKADVADSIRRVATRAVPVIVPPIVPPCRPTAVAPGSNLELASAGAANESAGSMSERTVEQRSANGSSEREELQVAWVAVPARPTEVEPLSGDRYAVRMTVGQDFVDEFRHVKDALSHVVPGGSMEEVLRECMRIAREACERRTLGSKRARAVRSPVDTAAPATETATRETSLVADLALRGDASAPDSRAVPQGGETQDAVACGIEGDTASSSLEPIAADSRYIPIDVRREVVERDEGCCAFVGTNGRRCRSTYRLQFHHRVPFAMGGLPTAVNLTLYCSRHNIHQAYEDYGAAHMDRFFVGRGAG